jgi:hypothetical protein
MRDHTSDLQNLSSDLFLREGLDRHSRTRRDLLVGQGGRNHAEVWDRLLTQHPWRSMMWFMAYALARITIDQAPMHGRPCIRNLRITVADILGMLSAGQARETILGLPIP